MKRIIFASLLALALLAVPLSCFFASAEETFTVNFTEFDGVGDDENGDGLVFVYEGRADSTRIIDSEKYNVRYMYIFVFDNYGHLVQIGNNLVFHSVDKSFQNFVVIPAGGFMVAFYYNTDYPTNEKLYNYYKTVQDLLEGKPEDTIYNRTLLIESNFSGIHNDSTLELHYGSYGTVLGDCTATDPESDDEPVTGDPETSTGPEPEPEPPQHIPEGGAAARITLRDGKCSCVDGEVAFLVNETGTKAEFLSDDYDFRYMFVMAFDDKGVCTDIGNNLVATTGGDEFQHGVKTVSGGFVVAFFYNNDNRKNTGLYELYQYATGGATIYNSTIKPTHPLNAYDEGEYIVVYKGEETAVPDESGEVSEPAESGSGESAAESAAESGTEPESKADSAAVSEPSESADASEPGESGTGAAQSAAESAAEENSGGKTGLIIGICAVVAAAAAAAVIIVKKRKNA
ncbi:MAG: hypothetical protein J5925_02565 [Clostridia bacterium]|nr:hypothetical protein [Clostridia bacterium]